ncbi:ABC transporter ATP-binding protein [Nannocystis sp. ILAH1]|uniref:ABC transporter ATP-binding protein n=1 Tax=Nannocystis sp. ILAH1 TaxID=2996789 RepID=UPI00226DBB62|nr:ABC transporter ATP-binding protein [Nannocystis sp. ILAH1]MCY0993120.1 ABC transporter ATP-binding protein [Nannocystis sp. ILAH1]
MTTTTAAIDVRRLGKRFGAVTAVDDVSFTIEPGEIFGFMGHNGAGKTTTLRMLLGLTQPTAGSATVLGGDVVRDTLDVRRGSGYLPAAYALPPDMTAREFLRYVGAMFGLPPALVDARSDELLTRFGLGAAADRKLRGFSTGMTQKVGLAQALINEPRVLFLDEPTSGLDPLGRHELLEHLRELARDRGVTVVFSSHILSDVETLCRRVAVMHHARLIACGELTALRREYGVATMDELYLALVRRHAA